MGSPKAIIGIDMMIDYMGSITSADRTEIAYERTGQGPPVVLVHGTACHRLDWREVVPALSEEFTVYAINRRGRDDSGDSEEYAIEREYEDIIAVLEHVDSAHNSDEPLSLVGHSYGAIITLNSILETSLVDRLVLFEPPLGDVPAPEGAAEGLEQTIEEEGREAAVEMFLELAVGWSEEEFEQMRGDELWDSRIETAPTLPREIKATQRDLFNPSAFADVSIPTTLLVGGDSPEEMHAAVQSVADAIPDSTIVTLEGQEHMAMHESPSLFNDALIDALKSDSNGSKRKGSESPQL